MIKRPVIKHVAMLMAVGLLSACASDDEPVKPHVSTTIGINSNGVNVGTSVGLSHGPLSIGLSL